MEKFKIFLKELGNIVTNLACPVIALVLAIMELCHAPASWIAAVKKAEYYC